MQDKTRSAYLDEVMRKWYIVSARGKVLGRLASDVAAVLRGKHKPTFTPHVDCGDHVIIIDAEGVRLTGRKPEQKMHYRHSGYPGHLRSESYGRLLEKEPDKVIWRAVKGMLPHNILGRTMLRKLRVYAGSEHPHEAQQPEPLPEHLQT